MVTEQRWLFFCPVSLPREREPHAEHSVLEEGRACSKGAGVGIPPGKGPNV